MAPPAIRIAVQNGFYTQPRLHGVGGDVFCMGGSAVLASNQDSLATVLGRSLPDVQAAFAAYLAAHPELTTATTALVVPDIEGAIIPLGWHNHSEPDQDLIIAAWKMRIDVVRAALPAAELGGYAVCNPTDDGDATEAAYVARLATMQRAHTEFGAFDSLDVLTPVLYPRWGPSDTFARWRGYRTYAEVGIDGTRAVGPALPVKPWIHHTIANPQSAHDNVQLLDLPVVNPLKWTWDRILAVLEARGVDEALFWLGAADQDLIAGSARSIYDYISPARPVRYYF